MANGQIQIPFPYINIPPSHIKALVQKIRSNINLTTHKKKFTKYENSFVGNELVSYLLKSKAVPSRRDGIEICRRLFEARLIIHVKNNELFKDDKELYHLIDPVAGSDLVPIEIDVNRARSLICNKGLPKNDNGYKSLIKSLQAQGLYLPEISRAICLEKYRIKDTQRFPQTRINKTTPRLKYNAKKTKTQHIKFAIENNPQCPTQLPPYITKAQLIHLTKTIIGILRYAFLAADQSRSNDLDLKEFEYLLDRLGIRVSHKGAELLFRAILSQHNKRFLGFYEFKMAFMVTDPMQFIKGPNDVHPARVLRRHIRQYYETVAEAHKLNRKKLAEIAWGLFSNDKTKNATMTLSEFREGLNYLGLRVLSDPEVAFIFRDMNRTQTGMLQKDEFARTVKKEIPVSLGKVVNVKEILFDAFENILKEYNGKKTFFPKRIRSQSIVNRSSTTMDIHNASKDSIDISSSSMMHTPVIEKKSIFQRMRYKSKAKRKKTIKAPVKTPFGSNLADMAESANSMMDDVISSMMCGDDNIPSTAQEDNIITAEQFKQLFSHPFFPKPTEEKEKQKVKPVNIKQLTMIKGALSMGMLQGMGADDTHPFQFSANPTLPKSQTITQTNQMESLPNPNPAFATKESASCYSSDNSEIYGDVYRSPIQEPVPPPPPPPDEAITTAMSSPIQSNGARSMAVNMSPTLNPDYVDTSAVNASGLPPPPTQHIDNMPPPPDKEPDGLLVAGTPVLRNAVSADTEYEEEEKQSTRKRKEDEESLLDLQNSSHLQKAMHLKNLIVSSHPNLSIDEGSYSPPPPTHLSADVGSSPPWCGEEKEEMQEDAGSGFDVTTQHVEYPMNDHTQITRERTLTESTHIQDAAFPAPDTQYIVEPYDAAGLDVLYPEKPGHDEDKPSDSDAFPAPHTQYTVDRDDGIVQRTHTDTTEHTIGSESLQRPQPTHKARLPTLILPDDLFNASDDELPDIPTREDTVSTKHTSDTLQNPVSDSSPPKSPAKRLLSTPISVHAPANVPIRKGTGLTLTSEVSNPVSDQTRVTLHSPSRTYENPIHNMHHYRLQRDEMKAMYRKKLENSEEDGLSLSGSSRTGFKYKEGRDSEFVQHIGDLDVRYRSDTEDSLRLLQIQYERESQLKDDLQLALFDNTNIDDHDDPHPKDMRRNIGIVKENEETDEKAMAVMNPHPAALNSMEPSGSVHLRDIAESSAANDDPLFEKVLKPSVAKRLSRGSSPRENTQQESVKKDTKYDQLYTSLTATLTREKDQTNDDENGSKKVTFVASNEDVKESKEAENTKEMQVVSLDMLPNKSVPYNTPNQFGAISIPSAPKIQKDKSQAIEPSSEDEDDPGAAGTADVDLIKSSEEDSADTYWPWDEGSSTDDPVLADSKRKSASHSLRDDEWKATPPIITTNISGVSQPPPITALDMKRISDMVQPPMVPKEEATVQIEIITAPPSMNMVAEDTKEQKKHKEKAKKEKKYAAFKELPAIPGVITLKSVTCTHLARGKMRSSETYYLRVYQGDCVSVESSQRKPPSKGSSPRNRPPTKRKAMTLPMRHADKIKAIKSRKAVLPPSKKTGSLPSLCVIKSYPVFAKQSQEAVTWKNLPASITKDAKSLTVGIYMKREGELVLIGSALLAKTKKNVIPKPRIGSKITSLTLSLNVPDKFSIWKSKSRMDLTYSFCPRQFNTDIRVLQATKLPMFRSKIPVAIQLIRLHLLKVTQDVVMTVSDEDSDSDCDDEYQNELHQESEDKQEMVRFYNTACPSKNAINHLVGDMNSGHYKLDKTEPEVVWHGLLRWFREVKPNALLHSSNIETEFVDSHADLDDDEFVAQFMQRLCEPYVSIFLWSIDLLIEMSEWYQEKLSIENKMIDHFAVNYFGYDIAHKTKLFLLTPNAYSFVIRILHLRKKLQFMQP
eukprot:1155339_1